MITTKQAAIEFIKQFEKSFLSAGGANMRLISDQNNSSYLPLQIIPKNWLDYATGPLDLSQDWKQALKILSEE
jgi:hypothetical protein